MSRYIDADKLQRHGNRGGVVYWRDIEAQPTADVIEVVRCKDCKHYVLHTLFGRTQGWCERLCDKFDKSLAHGTEGDDFCSYGERSDT